MRVLVVEDEVLILTLAASWLENLGCAVETAHNGNEALAKLSNGPRVDLLITDINMPGLSGHTVAERAAHIQPGLKVVLVSGAETDSHGLPLIRKPFVEADLRKVIRDLTG
jgi:two-component system cell cycle response regulator CpdR